ncbi:44144_t:CDS:1, partial [Gigaspora margarita]
NRVPVSIGPGMIFIRTYIYDVLSALKIINTSDCKFKKAIEIEKEKFKYGKCSRNLKPIYHYK